MEWKIYTTEIALVIKDSILILEYTDHQRDLIGIVFDNSEYKKASPLIDKKLRFVISLGIAFLNLT